MPQTTNSDEQLPQIINEMDQQPLTAEDIGKAVVVVDSGEVAIATKPRKHKFIVAGFDEKKGITITLADNADINKGKIKLEGKLIFYVEKAHKDKLFRHIKAACVEYLDNNADKEPSLVNLGNGIIKHLQNLDSTRDKALLLTKYASVSLAQEAYGAKGATELNPDTLESTETPKATDPDSISLTSDSGLSSQSDISAEDNAKPTPTLYPDLGGSDSNHEVPVTTDQQGIDAEKEEAIAGLQTLRSWIDKLPNLGDKVGILKRSIDKAVNQINGSSADPNSAPLNTIFTTLF